MRAAKLLALLVLLASAARPARGVERATPESALAAVFGDARIERKSTALSDAELDAAKQLCGETPSARLAIWHEATRDGVVVGRGWLDTHVVRTLPETILVSCDDQGRVLRVDVLTFREPPDYLPPARWLRQFDGKPLDADLAISRDIAALGGATLSGRAVTNAVRRCLALDAQIRSRAAKP